MLVYSHSMPSRWGGRHGEKIVRPETGVSFCFQTTAETGVMFYYNTHTKKNIYLRGGGILSSPYFRSSTKHPPKKLCWQCLSDALKAFGIPVGGWMDLFVAVDAVGWGERVSHVEAGRYMAKWQIENLQRSQRYHARTSATAPPPVFCPGPGDICFLVALADIVWLCAV